VSVEVAASLFRPGRPTLVLSSPGLTGRSSNRPPWLLDCPVKPGNDTERRREERLRSQPTADHALCGPPPWRYHGTVMARAIRILGIDPGLRRTGWGVIEADGNRLIYVGCGSAHTDDATPLAERLVQLHDALVRVVDEFRPDEAAVEATFVNKDAAATLKLGQARGIAMVVPAKAGVMIAEYAPNLVKKTIVGVGHCHKSQIRMMLGVLLPKADPGSHDAADALAVAITHAHHRQSAALRGAAR
jgi:crossover junction endodeoxyribonuclease RuvC